MIPDFTEGLPHTCLIDSIVADESGYEIWSAHRDDIYVIDADGIVRFYLNVTFDPLFEQSNVDALEALLLDLLAA